MKTTTNYSFHILMLVLVGMVAFVSCEETGVKRLTIPSKNTHPTCKKNEIIHSDVVQNHSLKRGLSPNNFTLLGKVPNMGDCMALCCSTKHCNIAYMRNNTCYGVTCYDAEKCAVKNESGTVESGTQLALLVRKEMNRKVFVTAYLVVVVCAFGAAMSGTVWAVFVFYKRYSIPLLPNKSGHGGGGENDDEEKGELLDEDDVDAPLLPRMHQ